MPRRQKKYHYIYKTTCLVTGKFYVGMHSTDDLEDGYLGSGKILGYSIAKHGRENHKRDIIEMCQNREALKLREKDIVNETLLADPLNINLKYGGDGGGKLWTPQQAEKFHKAGYKAMLKSVGSLSDISKRGAAGRTNYIAKRRLEDPDFDLRMRESSAKGVEAARQKNLMMRWINDGSFSKRILKTTSIPDGWYAGRVKRTNAPVAKLVKAVGSNPISL